MNTRLVRLLVAQIGLLCGACRAEPTTTVVALGDSITRGVRPGVKADETFAAILDERLAEQKVSAKVLNAGVGGERTDGALARLEKQVLNHKPKVVLVMYGTNDSYVDKGELKSRLSIEKYRENLEKLVDELRKNGAEPILMTEPRWAAGEQDGLGEDPNMRLARYLEVCRAVARDKKVRLVDHYQHWLEAEEKGTKLRDWTTDGCHPNPRGHREIADLIVPVLVEVLRASD
jgi:lysophospholipase L1-like esterase